MCLFVSHLFVAVRRTKSLENHKITHPTIPCTVERSIRGKLTAADDLLGSPVPVPRDVLPRLVFIDDQLLHCGKRQLMTSTITVISLLLVAVVATAAQKLERYNPPGLSKPQPGTYTHVVKSGKLLFVAGQTGVNADGKVVGPGMKEQVEQVMANLTAALKSQGADFSHVAKTTTYVTSISEFRSPEVAAVRAKYVGANPPANTLVQIQQLADPAYKVEIEAIAVLP